MCAYQIDRVDVKTEDLFLMMQSIVQDLGNLRTTLVALVADRDELKASLEDVETDLATLREGAMNLQDLALNRILSDPGLAVGSDTKKFATSAVLQYVIDGDTYSKAITDDIAQPASTNDASQFSKDLISIDAAGTITVTAGVKAASQGAATVPETPEDNVALGVIEVPNSFTPGTTDVTSGMLKPYSHGAFVGAVAAAVGSMTATVSALGTTIGS